MASVEEANKVTQFCEICGSDRETAEHVLDAHSWDLDRSIGFFLEHGASMPSGAPQHATELRPDLVEDPIQVTGSPPARPSAPPPQPVSAPQVHTTIEETEEDPDFDPEYERALQESRRMAGAKHGLLESLPTPAGLQYHIAFVRCLQDKQSLQGVPEHQRPWYVLEDKLGVDDFMLRQAADGNAPACRTTRRLALMMRITTSRHWQLTEQTE